MVAAEEIPIGTLLLLESPVAYVPNDCPPHSRISRYAHSRMEQSMLSAAYAATGEGFKGFAIILAARVIAASHDDPSVSQQIEKLCRNSFRHNHTVTTDIMASAQIVRRLLLGSISHNECTLERCIEVLEKLECNAFTVVEQDLSSITGIGLYTQAAAINHSCEPNCYQTFDSATLVIRASTKIKKGEEITIAYIDIGKSTWWRQNELLLSYGFSCSCARCCTIGFFDSYICQIPNCKGSLEIIEKDMYFSWIDSDPDEFINENQNYSIQQNIEKNRKLLSTIEIVVPHGDILFLNCSDFSELFSSFQTTYSSTLSPSSSSSSLFSSTSTLISPSFKGREWKKKKERIEKKRRFRCNCCQNVVNFDVIIQKVLYILHHLKDIKKKQIQGYKDGNQFKDCITNLLQIMKPSHQSVTELYRTYVLEDLILDNNFHSYVKTVRTSNYLVNVANSYPPGHPFPAIQEVMYSKCLLQICQSEDDLTEARTYLQHAIKILISTHGDESYLIKNIKDIMNGIS